MEKNRERNTKTQSLHMSKMCYITKRSPVKLVRLMTLKKGQQSVLSVATNTLFSSSRKHCETKQNKNELKTKFHENPSLFNYFK